MQSGQSTAPRNAARKPKGFEVNSFVCNYCLYDLQKTRKFGEKTRKFREKTRKFGGMRHPKILAQKRNRHTSKVMSQSLEKFFRHSIHSIHHSTVGACSLTSRPRTVKLESKPGRIAEG